MVDLHIHTKHSDGSQTTAEVLELAQKSGAKIISITDHDNLGAYKDLSDPKVRAIFKGKIIPGVEITTTALMVPVEILGYGIDLEKMEQNMLVDAIWKCQNGHIQPFLKVLKKHKIKTQEQKDWVKLFDEVKAIQKDFCAQYDELSQDYVYFFRKGIANPKSIFYHDSSKLLTSFEQVVKNIHKAGGIAIFAHPYECHEHREKILEYVKKKVDGIECIHPSATPAQSAELMEFCLKNKLLVSGGSDFHGYRKPNNWIGFTYGGVPIKEEYISTQLLAKAEM